MDLMKGGARRGTVPPRGIAGLSTALDELAKVAASAGLPLDQPGREQLGRWAELVVEWRSAAQLTGVTSAREVVRALMIPALHALWLLRPEPRMSIVDLGCGSGSTGAALAVAARAGDWVLVDRAEKKVTFCRYAIRECRIGNARALSLSEYRQSGGRADVVLARGLPRGSHAEETIHAVGSPGALIIRWVGGKGSPGGSAVRCGTLDLWVSATDTLCFT